MSANHATTGQVIVPVAPITGTLRPLGLSEVTITGGFWGERQNVNGTVTVQHCAEWLERLDWVGNFDRRASGEPGQHAGREFSDSETYKLLEALAWEYGRTRDSKIDDLFRSLAARVVAAQEEDGYLNTNFGGHGQPSRYSDLAWGHELYCAGHLIQAAVARLRTVGDDPFVQAARRLADHVCDTFGPGGLEGVCGHPEIEVALMEFARATGDQRYRDMAGTFLERRGHGVLGEIELGAAYFQDDMPIREATALRGHAVRALYLNAAAVDFAVDTADESLLTALEQQWENTVERRTYLTGGMGSRHEGEAFGDDFELPSDRAYSETCAGVGSVMLAWRLLLASGQERYADLVERTLYNVIAAAPDSGGAAFFYTNPLQQRTAGEPIMPDTLNPRAAGGQRAPWFAVSCCPTNLARTFASLAGYVATADTNGVQIHQYAPSRISTTLDDGRAIELGVQTDYPSSGTIAVRVLAPAGGEWTLSLRIPAWARGRATVAVNGETVAAFEDVARVTRDFRAGDEVVLTLPVEPRWTWPDPRVDALRGQVAVEQGPVVLCSESIDTPGIDLDSVQVSPTQPPVAVDGSTTRVGATTTTLLENGLPYRSSPAHLVGQAVELTLTPYHQWAERGPSTMRVWFPVESTQAAQS